MLRQIANLLLVLLFACQGGSWCACEVGQALGQASPTHAHDADCACTAGHVAAEPGVHMAVLPAPQLLAGWLPPVTPTLTAHPSCPEPLAIRSAGSPVVGDRLPLLV